MIYFDNAASSWPKPETVVEEMSTCLREYAANPGRGSHQLSIRAAKTILSVRTKLAHLFNAPTPESIIVQQNATEALNLAIKGYLQQGDHVISSVLEHNSVRRPLEYMRKQKNIEIDYALVDQNLVVQPAAIEQLVRPNTKLIVLSHASNVTGSLVDLEEVGDIADRYNIALLVDASQTAGAFSLDVQKLNISMLAFTGHKSLYGPQGTGGLYIRPNISLEPLMHGGTGGYSELIDQPPDMPDRYESGTRNTVGLAGLDAALTFIKEVGGVSVIQKHEQSLVKHALAKLNTIAGISVVGPPMEIERAPVISFLAKGYEAAEMGFILDRHYQIAVRTGLHCSPLAHEAVGTIEWGAVRVSFGYFNTIEEIDALIEALHEIIA